MICRKCGIRLNVSVYNEERQKSCPKCSVKEGTKHVFYDQNHFGFTDKRITKKNPEGIQSYCKECRSKSW